MSASHALPATAAPSEPRRWHEAEAAEVATSLASSVAGGLAAAEARRRLDELGPNELAAARRPSAWGLLLDQFRNVLILILLVAVALSAVLGHVTEAVVISVIVVFAAVLGFAQEMRAEKALDALRLLAAPTAAVVRDGEEVGVPARDLVPGDLILLRAGDRVPADARVATAVRLQVEESALTGESLPAEKQVAALPSTQVPLAERSNMVYAGTSVTYGRGRAIVVATGMRTEFGAVASMLESIERPKTPLQESLDRVAVVLARIALGVVLVVVALGLARGEAFLDMLLFGTAVAVAVVPEALPAVVTISLTLAAQRMAGRHALVRRLPAIETLGSVSVIGTDKTGTLTRDEMTVRRAVVAGRPYAVSGAGYEPVGSFSVEGGVVEPPAALVELLRGAALASDATVVRDDGGSWHVRGDPTEGALVVAAAKAGQHKTALDAQLPRVDEIPFTSERKRMTTIHDAEGTPVAYAKGAPEVIVRSCALTLDEGEAIALDEHRRAEILADARAMARQALRVLAVARKDGATSVDAEHDMTFLGLVGLIDPPRPEARPAVEACERAGIRPVLITGDHPLTATAIAGDLGLLAGGRTVTGAELEAMTDAELQRDIESIEVYARVSPADKLRVVRAWQAHGHTVAMTGDGVNDAPALKQADIGVAMGVTGTDVTKEAAAMTLTDDNFASIVAAVEEGRGVFANIRKYLMYLLSANLGEIGLLVGAALLGKPLPLSAVQILYVNLATDGLPALALSVDPAEPDLMRRPPRGRRTGIFTAPVVALIATGGAWSALVTLGMFTWALSSGRALAEAMTMTFATLVLIELFKAYVFRSDRGTAFRRPLANRWLNAAVVWELTLLALLVHVPFLRGVFGTTALSPATWLLVVASAGTVVLVLEAAKWVLRSTTQPGRVD